MRFLTTTLAALMLLLPLSADAIESGDTKGVVELDLGQRVTIAAYGDLYIDAECDTNPSNGELTIYIIIGSTADNWSLLDNPALRTAGEITPKSVGSNDPRRQRLNSTTGAVGPERRTLMITQGWYGVHEATADCAAHLAVVRIPY